MHIPNIDNSYCNSASAEYNISFLRSSIMSYISSNFVWTSTTLENSKCSWDACRMCRCGRRIHLSLFGVYTLCAVLSYLLVSCCLLFIYTDQYLSGKSKRWAMSRWANEPNRLNDEPGNDEPFATVEKESLQLPVIYKRVINNRLG